MLQEREGGMNEWTPSPEGSVKFTGDEMVITGWLAGSFLQSRNEAERSWTVDSIPIPRYTTCEKNAKGKSEEFILLNFYSSST
jgi:hypothetical protein